MNLLTVTNLSAGYAGKQVIKDISFFVAPKTNVGILGANGCGKTTLITAIANLLPHTGSCQLDDTYLENASPRQLALLCGYIPQKSGISIDLTLLDVVLMGFNPKLSLLQSPTEQMKKEAFDALCSVGLGSRKDDNFQQLSEGQKQDAESGAYACTGGCADNVGGSEGIAENGLIDKAGNSEDKAADCTDHSAACAQGEKNPPLYRVPG